MTIEYARHKLGQSNLTSEEFDEEAKLSADDYVVHFLPDQHRDKEKGRPCV